MASILKVDEMQGVTNTNEMTIAANNVTVTGEGTATMRLQNGLAKVWVNVNGATVAARDSLNVASMTDGGSGRLQPNYTNAFSAATYAICISDNGGSGNGGIYQTSDIATGSFIMDYRYNSSGSTYTAYDPDTGACGMFGDLA